MGAGCGPIKGAGHMGGAEAVRRASLILAVRSLIMRRLPGPGACGRLGPNPNGRVMGTCAPVQQGGARGPLPRICHGASPCGAARAPPAASFLASCETGGGLGC